MADNFTSSGSFGLPHFRNSRASQELYEPLYLNLFTIQISLPPGIGITGDEDTNLLLENIQNIGGLESNSFPGSTVAQNYKWAQRRFAGAKPDKTTMDIQLTFEVNLNRTPSAYILKTLRKWNDLIYDPLTGRTGLKVDYVAPWMLITLYDRASNPYWQWKCYNVFPITALPAPNLAYQSDEVYKIEGYTLAVDSWDETIV
jgi:hypothetical protein